MANQPGAVQLMENIAVADIPASGGARPGATEKVSIANLTDTIPDASTTVKGIAELATNAEVAAGTDTTRIVTAAALAAAYPRTIQTISASGVAQTLDINTYAAVNLTLTGNCVLSLTDPAYNGLWSMLLYVTEGGAGGYSLTFPASVLFDGGLQPVFDTTLASVSKWVLTARRVAGVTTWDVALAADGLATV